MGRAWMPQLAAHAVVAAQVKLGRRPGILEVPVRQAGRALAGWSSHADVLICGAPTTRSTSRGSSRPGVTMAAYQTIDAASDMVFFRPATLEDLDRVAELEDILLTRRPRGRSWSTG